MTVRLVRVEPGRWYTAREAGSALSVTEQTIKSYLRSGKIPGKRIGPKRQWHVEGQEIARLAREWGLDVIANAD